MNDLKDYSNSTSEHELFGFFYKLIISGKICTFSALKELAAPILGNQNAHPAILQASGLIKRLYWGFFAELTPQTHQKLWKAMVISDKDFPDAGDIKRTLQISDIFISMLDIHGYTKFCMDTRKNLSMMHILDQAMEIEAGRISASCGAVSHRGRGDEMVVVAASATDALTATLGIIDYFSKTDVVKDPKIITRREGDAAGLPAFKISAGITGGNTTSPLTITDKGDLNGFLLNSGARLQTRANELSPRESKVMIARQVQMNFEKENAASPCSLAQHNTIYFFDTGHIEFKGVTIPTCEVIFRAEERYKEKYAKEMAALMEATRENLWEQRIFTDMLQLISQTVQVMPQFSVPSPIPIEGIQTFTNTSLVHFSKKAMIAYVRDEDYAYAISLLGTIVDILEAVPDFDRLIMDYLKGIYPKYAMLIDPYNASIEQQIDENARVIFQDNYLNTWIAAKKGAQLYKKFLETGKASKLLDKKKSLWLSLIKQKKGENEMVFTMYSGKK